MIEDSMSDLAILKTLGKRLRRQRLDRNITQQELADRAGLSRPTISDIERGNPASLLTLIRILRVLDLLGELAAFLPDPLPSPLELVRQRGRKRQRASGSNRTRGEEPTEPDSGEPSW